MDSLHLISSKFTKHTLSEIVKGATVKDVKLDLCDNRGCSYLSEVSRLQITAQNEPSEQEFIVHSVVKALPKSIARSLTFRSPVFFDREIDFFTKVCPQFEAFQGLHNISQPFDDVPRCFATFADGQNDFIAMEDLNISGYKPFDRQLGVDAEHCRLALESLGRFHGVSHAMRTLEPLTFAKIAQPLKDHYYAESARSWFEGMASLEISVARAALKEECPATEIEDRIHAFTDSTPNFYSRMIEMTHNFNPKYAVIGHGDCWLPNFLFSYSKQSGQPERVKMIDFQLARHCSSALDILFFIYSCTTQELREKHFQDMIKWYYEGVSHILTQFKLNPEEVIPRSVLHDELKQFGKYGVGVAMEAIPLTIMPSEDTTDMEAIQGDVPLSLPQIWRIKPMDKEGRCRLVDVFRHSIKEGYL